jgi:methylated-thiol--corrinoid protein
MPMHMDEMLQQMYEMKLKDPVKFNRLVQEGEAVELGFKTDESKEKVTVDKLKKQYFPKDPEYAKVSQAVLDGKRAVVEPLVHALLGAGKDPVDVVTNALMPGIQVQCEMYDLGKAFVPEILMSNDAMQAGIAICQLKQGEVPKKGVIASFVAAGDLHDIGKNICAAILRANGFKVIDIGRDVPKEKVLETVKANNVQLVCGSTLMSTTKPGLTDTALLLELQKTGVSVACGGAAVSRPFVDTFTNAMYTKTPLETVKVASSICDGKKKWQDYRQ